MTLNHIAPKAESRLKKVLMSGVGKLLGDIPQEEMCCLFSPGKHMALLSSRRAAMIISRVRLVAALFAVLTPLWIVIDLIVFTWPLSTMLALGRIVVSAAFAVLALQYRRSNRMRDAYLALIVMFAIPTLFFIYSQQLISMYRLVDFAISVSVGYAFLPFVMMAGLSIFPLTVFEGAAFAIPVLLADLYSELAGYKAISTSAFLGTFWLLLLIAIVAIFAGMSQLGFMIVLVRQAIRDTLTGCFSRLSGEELIEMQFILSTRNKTPLSLAFIDIDNFKSVNDNFGHESGDHVLASVADSMRSTLRSGEMLVRWGGEEFIIIFPCAHCANALEAVERLREKGLGTQPDGQPITVSIGLAERTQDSAANWHQLVETADRRMYLAKQGGKNRVVCE